MVDLAPFLYLALIVDIVAVLVAAGICFLVGSYYYRTFSGRFRVQVSTLKRDACKHPEIRRPLDIFAQPRNA